MQKITSKEEAFVEQSKKFGGGLMNGHNKC